MELVDKLTLQVFLANMNRFRLIRDRIKKQSHLTALGSLAIKYIIQFQGNPALVWISSMKEATAGRERVQHQSLSHRSGACWGSPRGAQLPSPGRGILVQHLDSETCYENISGERGNCSPKEAVRREQSSQVSSGKSFWYFPSQSMNCCWPVPNWEAASASRGSHIPLQLILLCWTKPACYPGDTKTTPPERSGKAAVSSAGCQEPQGIPKWPRSKEEQGNPSCAPSMGCIPVPAACGEGLQPSTGTPEDPGHGGSAPGPLQAIQDVGEG